MADCIWMETALIASSLAEHRDIAIEEAVNCVIRSISDLEVELKNRVVEVAYAQ